MPRLRSDRLLVECELAESTSLGNQLSASSRTDIVATEPCTKCERDRKECRQPLPEQNVKICERCQTLEIECSFASPSVPKPDSPQEVAKTLTINTRLLAWPDFITAFAALV